MGNLAEKAVTYYSQVHNLNCAEATIYAANQTYNLGLQKDTLRTMAAFGGGMGVGSVCGALTGALAVLGVMFVQDKAHESTETKEMASAFFNRFVEKLSTDNCTKLKEMYRDDITKCDLVVRYSNEILEEMINKRLNNE
ncbi:MAG: C-GCAxxG-C-C family (seleno)protein [Eubacteriales bacterium]|nr:C-GCAxxG-C-C family (seleno)protein [Eubacteriales bacterium]